MKAVKAKNTNVCSVHARARENTGAVGNDTLHFNARFIYLRDKWNYLRENENYLRDKYNYL